MGWSSVTEILPKFYRVFMTSLLTSLIIPIVQRDARPMPSKNLNEDEMINQKLAIDSFLYLLFEGSSVGFVTLLLINLTKAG